jgi:hypothetical protein
MKKINFQAIATTIQKDLRKKGAFHDKDEIVSRVNDLSLIECGSPTVIVEFDVDAANDED